MHHAGAQTRQMRRAARTQLICAHDAVHEDIVPHPHDVAATAILDRKVLIGNSAGQRQRVHAPEPDRQRSDARR